MVAVFSFYMPMKSQMSLVLAVSGAVLLMTMLATVSCNEDPANNFFLKASKSVPRIGRRSDNFFLKAAKSVPRIGRRRTLAPLVEGHDAVAAWPWYRTADSIPGPSRREEDAAAGSQYDDNLTWEDIEKAVEENPEVWTPELLKNIISHKDDQNYQRHLQSLANDV